MSEGTKTIAVNRKARHDYTVDDRYECGIELLGTEVKSFRDGKISFPDAWAGKYGCVPCTLRKILFHQSSTMTRIGKSVFSCTSRR